MKHSHSSLDAQTISTFDSSNGDNPGFYHKYASAWSQLQNSAAILHSGSYKPSLAARLDPFGGDSAIHPHHASHYHHHHGSSSTHHTRSTRAGTINEGFRDTNEITLNADVYTRSSSGGSGGSGDHNHGVNHNNKSRYANKRGSGGSSGGSSGSGSAGDHGGEWQHLTRAKY